MKTKEQLQAEIIEKQKEIDKAKTSIINHYQDYVYNIASFEPEIVEFHEDTVKELESELSALESEGEEETCWNCKQREGEECGITGKEVYEDTPKCSQYSQK